MDPANKKTERGAYLPYNLSVCIITTSHDLTPNGGLCEE